MKKLTPQQKARKTRFRNTIARCVAGIIENAMRNNEKIPRFILDRPEFSR